MACECVSWPIVGTLKKSTIKTISYVFGFDKGDNCLYITSEGDIYALGKNGERAPLGLGSSDFIREPKRIPEFEDESKAPNTTIIF